MGTPDPFADDPYSRLGVSKTDSMDDIERQAKKLIKEYMQKAQQANTQSEAERFEQAYNNLEDAYVKIKEIKGGTGKNRRALVASAEPETVRLNEEVEITVKDDMGDPVSGCELMRGERRKGVTGEAGKATVKMDSAGSVTIDVKKDPAAGVSYNDTSVEITVKKKQTQLRFENPPSEAKAGQQVPVQVVNDSGVGISDVTVESPTDSANTNSSGEASISVDDDGDVEIKASRSAVATTTYRSASFTLRVKPRRVRLSFANSPSSAVAGGSATFDIVDDDGAPVDGARVSVEGDSAFTNGGTATVKLSSVKPGKRSVTVDKTDGKGVTYASDTTSLRVSKRGASLSLAVDNQRPTVGDTVGVKVTNGSDGEPNVEIHVDGTKRATTSASGNASFTVQSAGECKVVAQKPDDTRTTYHDDFVKLDVQYLKRQLSLREVPAEVTASEEMDIVLKDDTGSKVAGAEVRAEKGTRDETDAEGAATVQFNTAGNRRELVVEKPPDKTTRYKSDTKRVAVEKPKRRPIFDVCPEEATVGEKIRVRIIDNFDTPCQGATVKVSGDSRTTAGPEGWATLPLNDTGFVKITAFINEEEFEGIAQANVWVEQ